MTDARAKILMWVGAALMVMGIAFPFLMVIKILKSTLFLNFFSYTMQMLGLILAIIGLTNLAITRKKS